MNERLIELGNPSLFETTSYDSPSYLPNAKEQNCERTPQHDRSSIHDELDHFIDDARPRRRANQRRL